MPCHVEGKSLADTASLSHNTQVYAQVTDKKISEDMDRLIAKHQEKNKEDDKVTVKETITIGTMAIANIGRNKSMEETA